MGADGLIVALWRGPTYASTKKDGFMTGNNPKRKIQALTVSVNYADFLACIVRNAKHFDSWLVVTEEGDDDTIAVCKQHGIDYMFSKRLREDGAIFHKAAALNEGLETLDQDAWVIVLDSDILLPGDFRNRLDRQELDPECLYGLGGRRVCTTFQEFAAVANHEPWADNLVHTTFVIGYFNLFHLGQKQNRYSEKHSKDASTYDVIFSDSFPVANRKYLPFACLHAGEASQNWGGRITAPFFTGGEDLTLRPAENRAPSIMEKYGGIDRVVAQIGCYHGSVTSSLSAHFKEVIAIDHWGIFAASKSISKPLAVDLDYTCDTYTGWVRDLTNVVHPPLPNSYDTLSGIKDGSLDVLWLSAEPEYDFLLHFLPLWLPKLKPGGVIVGNFYNPSFVAPTTVVNLLLGAPDQVFDDSHWVRKIPDPVALGARLAQVRHVGSSQGVVYVSVGDDIEAILISITSLRRHWDGPVCVLTVDPTNSASLQLACLKIGVEYREAPIAELPHTPDDMKIVNAVDWSPFDRTVFLHSHTIVHGRIDFLFDAVSQDGGGNVFCTSRGQRPGLMAFAWNKDSTAIDAVKGAMLMFLPVAGRSVTATAINVASNELTLIHDKLWDGPTRQCPDVPLQNVRRGAGALHLHKEWSQCEADLLATITRG